MRVIVGFLASATLVWAATAQDSERIQKDKRDLQGRWKVIAAEDRGETVAQKDIALLEVIFNNDNIVIREDDKVQHRFTYKIDPEASPKSIDLTYTEGPKKGRIDRGVYELKGNELRMCMQQNKDMPRPKDFTTAEGTDLSLIVLRRFK